MSLSDVVTVSITAQTKAPTRTGFGVPLIMAYHTVFPERVREYAADTAVASMIADGFASDHPAVRAVSSVVSQNPKVETVLVGREVNSEKQKLEVYPVDATKIAEYEYTFELNGIELSFTTDASPTVAEICDGIVAAVSPSAWVGSTGYSVGAYVKNDTAPVKVYKCVQTGTSAGSGGPTGTSSGITDGTCKWDYVSALPAVAATDGTTKVTIEASTLDDYFTFDVPQADRRLYKLANVTPDGSPDGIAADIAAVQLVNDSWYCLLLTNQGAAVIEAAADYIETLYKIMVVSSSDDEIYDPAVTDDIASTLQTAGYARTALIYQHKATEQYPCAALVGACLPKDPGSVTWKFKTLSGVDYTDLSDTEISAIRAKSCNMYIRLAGISFTQEGVTGAGEFIDITHGVDWLRARLQENIFFRLVNADKVPYTDKGVALIESEIRAVLREGIGNDFLAATPEPTVEAPLVADVSALDRAARLLPDVKFEATLAGAIHKVEIDGVVSV